ncbi:protein phosphatase 2C domain-containing protein [Candidatus Uhrbacteria bacterium]|nr:protein phosphatase 2C domain-containing protein [Candidatus Uhrbacteria bacterium]
MSFESGPKKFNKDSLFADSLKESRQRDGTVYGEWHTARMEEKEPKFYLKTRLAEVAGQTSPGGPKSKYGKVNEDCLSIASFPKRSSIILIDGAGGSGNGRLAAEIGTGAMTQALRQGKSSLDAWLQADDLIRQYGQKGYAVGVLANITMESGPRPKVEILSVGDSKLMTIRDGQKVPELTTKFQNVAQQMVDNLNIKPEDYYNDDELNILTAAIGIKEKDKPQMIEFVGQEGDLLIVASDGVWDVISEFEIEEICREAKQNPGKIEEKIYKLAHKRNNSSEFEIQHNQKISVTKRMTHGGDNITLAVMKIDTAKFNNTFKSKK